MHIPSVKHTIDIFERLYKHVQAVLSTDLRKDVEHALEHMQHDFSLTLDEVEDTLIIFGKKIWPYRKAFDEFVSVEEGHHGEKIFLAKLPLPMKKRFKAFLEQGGSLRDLHTGSNANFFKPEERISLCSVLIEMKGEIRDIVVQAVKSTNKIRFEKRILEFQNILDQIETELGALNKLADEEQEHPHLASEIRAQIRGFEHGLCLLGPEAGVEAICLAAEHFVGRKAEIKIRP